MSYFAAKGTRNFSGASSAERRQHKRRTTVRRRRQEKGLALAYARQVEQDRFEEQALAALNADLAALDREFTLSGYFECGDVDVVRWSPDAASAIGA